MFQQFWEFLAHTGRELIPIAEILPWELGVMMRCGKFKRVLEPGWHFKIPYIDSYISHTVVTTTMSLPPQTVVTKDGKSIVVEAVARYCVDDIRVFLLEVHDQKDAVQDLTEGSVADVISSKMWQQCVDDDIENEISIIARREVKRFGVRLDRVILTTIAPVKSLRIISGNHHSNSNNTTGLATTC